MNIVLAVCGTWRYFGMPKYFYFLVKYLTQKGVDVTLVVDSTSGVDKLWEICRIPNVDVVAPEVRNSLTTMAFTLNLSTYLSRREFDILHTCHVNSFGYQHQANHKPIVFQPFGNELFTLENRGLSKLKCKSGQPILRFCGHEADCLLAEGEFQWKEMVRIYGNEKRMKILPVGIDTSAITPKSDYTHVSPFKILAVNSLVPYENMGMLIDAFNVVRCHIPAELTIVGSGPLEKSLKEKAKGLPVTFLKELPEKELYALYTASDLFVSPSDETDMQMGMLEAIAEGLPVVTINQRWMIDGNGVVVQRKGYEALADGIVGVLSGNMAEMGLKSREIVKVYDFPNIADRAIEIYQELV